MAEEIAKQTGADLVSIEPETPYDSNRDHYNALEMGYTFFDTEEYMLSILLSNEVLRCFKKRSAIGVNA